MKNIIYLLLLFSSILYAEIDERKSDVYFANGINTDERDAKKSIDKIKTEFKKAYPERYKSVVNWGTSYNHTHGIGIDLYESMLQKIYEDKPGESLVPFIFNLSEIADYFKFSFKGLITKVANKAPKEVVTKYASDVAKNLAKKVTLVYNSKYGKNFTEEQIELMFEHVFNYLIDETVSSYVSMSEEEILAEEEADVIEHQTQYIKNIRDGHRVVVVAHSQGNLFTNRIYQNFEILEKDKWMQSYMTCISLASPANNVIGEDFPYLTFDNDMIQLVPDSLPTNATNPKRYSFTNAVGEKIETLYSVEAHSFLSSYMATDFVKDAVLGVMDIYTNPDFYSSQWIVKDYKMRKKNDRTYFLITMKHEHDSSIVMGEITYPFTGAGKLYHVTDNIGGTGWVHASPGGDEVVDSWGTKTVNQVFMVNNENKETVNFVAPITTCTIVDDTWSNNSTEYCVTTE